MKMKLQIIFFIFFFMPGFIATGYATKIAAESFSLKNYGTVTSGVIVQYDRQENMKRVGRRFCPEIEFFYNEVMHRFTDEWCNISQINRPVGTAVSVVFNTNNPSDARINEFMVLYGKSLFVGAIGFPFLLLGIALVLLVGRKKE